MNQLEQKEKEYADAKNEKEYAKIVYKNLLEFKNDFQSLPDDYIACEDFININELKQRNFNPETFIENCKKLNLFAEYATNVKGIKKLKYVREHVNELIVIRLY